MVPFPEKPTFESIFPKNVRFTISLSRNFTIGNNSIFTCPKIIFALTIASDNVKSRYNSNLNLIETLQVTESNFTYDTLLNAFDLVLVRKLIVDDYN
nr:hypothetical protein BCU29_02235 [Vibrio lentus]